MSVAQAQMKAATFGLAEAAGGMSGTGVAVDDRSALQHPQTSKSGGGMTNAAWMPGVAMVSGAVFLTNFRLVFHRAGDGLTVDKSVKEKNIRARAKSRSPMRSDSRGLSSRSESSGSIGSPPDLTRKPTEDSLCSLDSESIPENAPATARSPPKAEKPKIASADDFVMPTSSVLKVECFGEHEYGIIKVNIPTLGIMTKDGRAVKFVLPFQLGNTHDSCLKLGRSVSENAFENGTGMPQATGSTTWGGEWTPPEQHVPKQPWGAFPFIFKIERDRSGKPLAGAGDEVFGRYVRAPMDIRRRP